ncbi:MAG: site-2 protease family protein [Ruminococcus sp.]|nr:site-2 protease family protein [Ruminococcus sp.]
MGLFNILPVMSLDGGQLLYLILSRFFSDTVSQRIVNVITFIIIFPLATFGFILLFNSKYNFSLLIVCIYLVFSLICRNNKYF